MGIFSKPEFKFQAAMEDAQRFVRKFEEAAKDASRELLNNEEALGRAVDDRDATIEKAYSKYMKTEQTENAKYQAKEEETTNRSYVLAAIVAKSNKAASNFKKLFDID